MYFFMYIIGIDVHSDVRYNVHMNTPITISEFRKNTKVILDTACLNTVYLMRGGELFELRRTGWEHPNDSARVIAKTRPVSLSGTEKMCKEHGVEVSVCRLMKHKRKG